MHIILGHLGAVLARLNLVHKVSDVVLNPLSFQTVGSIVEPGVIRVLRAQVFVCRVEGCAIKESVKLNFLRTHLVSKILAISHNISVQFTKLFVFLSVCVAQLLQELAFVETYDLDSFSPDHSRLKHSFLPAFHHLFEAELAAVTQSANSSFDDQICSIPRDFFLADRICSRVLN